jgi:hypothetical protein
MTFMWTSARGAARGSRDGDARVREGRAIRVNGSRALPTANSYLVSAGFLARMTSGSAGAAAVSVVPALEA